MSKVRIPVELIDLVLKNKLQKSFQLFIYLKGKCRGQLHSSSKVWKLAMKELKIKDNRTFKKNLNKLKELNWIGYDPKSSYYFIRGFDKLRELHNLTSRHSAIFPLDEIGFFIDGFLPGAIISYNIRKQQFANKKAKSSERIFKKGSALELPKTHGSEHGQTPFKTEKRVYYTRKAPDYFGISNLRISKLLYVKESQARDLKHSAERAGYIKTQSKIDSHMMTEANMYMMRDAKNNWKKKIDPFLAKRLRFLSIEVDGKTIPCYAIQQHDEITPFIRFKNRKPFSRVAPYSTSIERKISG